MSVRRKGRDMTSESSSLIRNRALQRQILRRRLWLTALTWLCLLLLYPAALITRLAGLIQGAGEEYLAAQAARNNILVLVSGWIGLRQPLAILAVITLRVSATGTLATATIMATSPSSLPLAARSSILSALSDDRVLITYHPISSPITIVPPSPINIFDLRPNTLCMKNGTRLAAKQAESTQSA